MFRFLEAVGILAPIGGIVVMVMYRRRATAGVAWGTAGAVLSLIASLLGLLGPRVSLLGGGGTSGEAFLGNMHMWALLRLALLALSVALLVVGAYVGRRGSRKPVVWLATGIPLVLVGFALSFIHVELGGDSAGLSEILGLLVEIVQFAMLGLGVIALSLAVVSDRSNEDGRREPAAVVVGAAMNAKRFYDRIHDRRR